MISIRHWHAAQRPRAIMCDRQSAGLAKMVPLCGHFSIEILTQSVNGELKPWATGFALSRRAR
jgi:hypothetical protein